MATDGPVPEAADVMGTIRATTRAFVQLAMNHREYCRTVEKERLLKRGGLVKEYPVGSKAVYYAPPTASHVKARGRKAKHTFQWKGPATVVRALDYCGYEMKKDDGSLICRTLINMRPFKGVMSYSDDELTVDDEAKADDGVAHDAKSNAGADASDDDVVVRDMTTDDADGDNDNAIDVPVSDDAVQEEQPSLFVGEVIAVLGAEGDKRYWVGSIEAVEPEVVVNVVGTQGASLKKAKWKPMYTLTCGRVQLSKRSRGKRFQLTYAKATVQNFVVARGLGLRCSDQLTSTSLKKLEGISTEGYGHIIAGHK